MKETFVKFVTDTTGIRPVEALTLSSILVIVLSIYLASGNRYRLNLPPGPPCLPIVGSLFSLDSSRPMHHVVAEIAEKYGPIIHLKLGGSHVIVVSSFEIAEAVLKTGDHLFASRPRLRLIQHTTKGQGIGFAFVGTHHTQMRRLTVNHLLASKKMEFYRALWLDLTHELIQTMLNSRSDQTGWCRVNLTHLLDEMLIDHIGRAIFGGKGFQKDMSLSSNAKAWRDYKDCFREFADLAGSFFAADHFPLIRWLGMDLMGYERRSKNLWDNLLRNTKYLLATRRQYRESPAEVDGVQSKTIADILLDLVEKDETMSNETMISLIFEFFLAGTETVSQSIDWAMAYLLRHPSILHEAQRELDAVVGKERLVSNSDISNLPLVRGIMLESFRLQPAAPLNVPHFNVKACKLAGYDIPANSTILVNFWSIGRDRRTFEYPDEFRPDRYKHMKSKGPVGADADQMVPFSMGRRGCPGRVVALEFSQLILARLLHSCDWNLPPPLTPETISMEVQTAMGGTVPHRVEPLILDPVPRLPLYVYE